MFGLIRGKRERLRRQASDWLARLQGPATAGDRAAFRRWYDSDPAHAEAFQRAATRQGVGNILTGTEFARTHTLQEHAPQQLQRRPYAMAAGLAALVVISGAVLLGRPESLMAPAEAEVLFYSTSVGEIREVPLADGTRMTLDTKTAVSVMMSAEMRQVRLTEGRARFAVAAGDQRPFVVQAGPGRVTGRDSIFDVGLRSGAATVQPIKGAVAVGRAGGAAEPVRLAPGQAILVSPRGDRSQVQRTSRSESLWPSGRLEFDNTPLDRAVMEANRYSRGRILLGRPELARLRVSGTFRAGDLKGLAQSLEAAFGLRLEQAGSNLVLHPSISRRPPGDPKEKGG